MPDLSGREDIELADAARNGDREAFAVLYHRFKSDVWSLAYLTMRSRHEAEDCVQETFVRALRALRKTPEINSVRAWLLTICRNVCLDRIRASRRHAVGSLDDVSAEPAAPECDDDLHIDFYRALRELPEADRQAFMLVDVLGCRSHEAATILGVDAASTVRSRLARARRQLAPAVTEADTRRTAAEIWGVYHAPSSGAIVATYGDSTGRIGERPLKQLIRDLSRPHAHSPHAAEMLPGLITFFEGLDDRIPHTTPVMAAITGDGRPEANVALHWLENHPRWRVRRQPTHDAWLLEVHSLLEAAGERSHFPPLRALQASATAPFLWMATA